MDSTWNKQIGLQTGFPIEFPIEFRWFAQRCRDRATSMRQRILEEWGSCVRPAKLPSETRQWSVAACTICWQYRSLQAICAIHAKLKSMDQANTLTYFKVKGLSTDFCSWQLRVSIRSSGKKVWYALIWLRPAEFPPWNADRIGLPWSAALSLYGGLFPVSNGQTNQWPNPHCFLIIIYWLLLGRYAAISRD